MTRLKMTLDDFDMFKTWWKGPGKGVVINRLGTITMVNVEHAFKNQGRGGEWPPRYAPNVAGIIRRLNKQEDPRATDFVEMPALLDSGALKNSFEKKVDLLEPSTLGYVKIHSTSPHAYRMERGLIDRLKLEPVGRRHLAMWLKGLSDEDRKLYRADIGWLLNKKKKRKKYRVKPQKRVMLRMNTADVDELRRYVEYTIRSFVTGKKKKIMQTERTTNVEAIFRRNVVDVRRGPRTSHFAPKGKRGKPTYIIHKMVKPQETAGAFTAAAGFKAAYTQLRFPRAKL